MILGAWGGFLRPAFVRRSIFLSFFPLITFDSLWGYPEGWFWPRGFGFWGNYYFLRKKADFRGGFLHGQCSVAEPGPTPSPWSILIYATRSLPGVFWGNFNFFTKKNDFRAFFLHGQHSVTEPGPTLSPWSIQNIYYLHRCTSPKPLGTVSRFLHFSMRWAVL